MPPTEHLAAVLSGIWRDLQAGAADPKDEFYTATLGTLAEEACQLRTVVLRQVLPGSRAISCYTDIRSAKVAELSRQPTASWLFWSPARQVQIRAEGAVRIHHQDETALAAWQTLSPGSRRAYATELPPAQPVSDPTDGLPSAWHTRPLDPALTETVRSNFGLLVCTVRRFDWVSLDPAGYRRASFEWVGQDLAASWLIP